MQPLEQSKNLESLRRIIRTSPWFMSALQAVQSLHLRSWCIGAGAVRNLVWDHIHQYDVPSALSDIDVAYFDDYDARPSAEAEIQAVLDARAPGVPWEVTNQALVHLWFEGHFGNAVAPLGSLREAVASWPEYATSVGTYLDDSGAIQIIAPYGLEDLFELRVRRNPTRVSVKTYRQRVEQKQYKKRWPRVTVEL